MANTRTSFSFLSKVMNRFRLLKLIIYRFLRMVRISKTFLRTGVFMNERAVIDSLRHKHHVLLSHIRYKKLQDTLYHE